MTDAEWWVMALIILFILVIGFKLMALLLIFWLIFQCIKQVK